MKQYLEVPSNLATFECSSPGELVDVRDGCNLDADLAYGNHPTAHVHRDATTDKIRSDVILGRALVYDVKFTPWIWVYVSLLGVVRGPIFHIIQLSLLVQRFGDARIDGTDLAQG